MNSKESKGVCAMVWKEVSSLGKGEIQVSDNLKKQTKKKGIKKLYIYAFKACECTQDGEEWPGQQVLQANHLGHLVHQRLNIIQNYNMATKDADVHKLKLRSLYAPKYPLDPPA